MFDHSQTFFTNFFCVGQDLPPPPRLTRGKKKSIISSILNGRIRQKTPNLTFSLPKMQIDKIKTVLKEIRQNKTAPKYYLKKQETSFIFLYLFAL